MNRFAFRIYSRNDPRRSGNAPVNCEEIPAALNRFCEGLPQYMVQMNASAQAIEPLLGARNALRVVMYTRLDWAEASEAMIAYAARHGLYATHVANAFFPEPSAPLGTRPSFSLLHQA